MIFSLDYRNPLKTNAEEIRCPSNQLGTIIKFIQENPHKRYNIQIKTDEDLDKTKKQVDIVRELTNNYTVCCFNISQLFYFLDNGYNAYIYFPVVDWETFAYLRERKVSDIYIDGPLAFCGEKIKSLKGDIKIRISPTVSSNSALVTERKPSSFFVRPEDLDLYQDIVDIIDFCTTLDTEEALYKVYSRKQFVHNIDRLILNLPKGINNVAFKPTFAECRINCEQKCNIPGYSCHFCENFFTLLSTFNQLIDNK